MISQLYKLLKHTFLLFLYQLELNSCIDAFADLPVDTQMECVVGTSSSVYGGDDSTQGRIMILKAKIDNVDRYYCMVSQPYLPTYIKVS